MQTLYEGRHAASFLLSELPFTGSRDNLVVAASQTIVPGQVLGRRAVLASASAVATPAAGNAGDGALTMDGAAPVRSDAEAGTYTIEFLTAGATAAFHVIGPGGNVVGAGAVGTPFAGPIKFAIADDAAKHYAAGDHITVAVAVGTFEHGAFDPAATDGLQVPAAVALYGATTAAGASDLISGIMRTAEVNGHILTWPAGISDAARAAAIATLARKSIIVR